VADLFFALSKAVTIALLPGNLVVILALAGLGFACFRRTRVWGVRTGLAAGALLIAGAVLPIGPLMLRTLERRFAPLDACYMDGGQQVAGIVLLGGGVSSSAIEGRVFDNLNEAADRLWLAARLAQIYPGAPLIISGGQAFDTGVERPEADAMRDLLVELGVPASQLVLERQSRTTAENAALSASRVTGGDWLLVTSAFHMPRAIGTFRKAGLSVIAAPTDWRVSDANGLEPFDAVANLATLNLAAKEYLGLLGYWASGRSGAILPGPAGTSCSASAV
jgi:uncharacterized SAM-binding protein YcdF (DUF218 family)